MEKIIDTHSHIHFPQYDLDRADVVARARAAGVAIIAIGTNLETSQSAFRIAEVYSDDICGTSVGLHPTHEEDFDADAFRKLAMHERVRAVGECGLDYYRITNQKSRIKQQEIFSAHIELSRIVQKPLIIHCRDAHDDCARILSASKAKLLPDRAGVMHFFGGSGSWERVSEYLDLGFYISFAGTLTFKNYTHAEDVKRIPLSRLLVETDAPYVAPEPHRGKRNEPSYIVETVKKLAELRSLSYDEVAEATTRNARSLFSL